MTHPPSARRNQACRPISRILPIPLPIQNRRLPRRDDDIAWRLKVDPGSLRLSRGLEGLLGKFARKLDFRSRTEQLPHNWSEVPKGKETRAIAAKRAGFGSAETGRRAELVVGTKNPCGGRAATFPSSGPYPAGRHRFPPPAPLLLA